MFDGEQAWICHFVGGEYRTDLELVYGADV